MSNVKTAEELKQQVENSSKEIVIDNPELLAVVSKFLHLSGRTVAAVIGVAIAAVAFGPLAAVCGAAGAGIFLGKDVMKLIRALGGPTARKLYSNYEIKNGVLAAKY